MSQSDESIGGSSTADASVLSESAGNYSFSMAPVLDASSSSNPHFFQSTVLELYHKPREKNYSKGLTVFGSTWRALFRVDERHNCGGVFLDCQDATDVTKPQFSKLVSFVIYVFRAGTNPVDDKYIYKLEKTFRFEHTKVGQPMKNNHGAYNFLSKEEFIAGTGFVDPITKTFKIRVEIDDDEEKANKKEKEKKEKQKKKEKERSKDKDKEKSKEEKKSNTSKTTDASQSQSQIQDPSKSFVPTVGEIKFVDLSKSKDEGPQGSELLKAAADDDGAATVVVLSDSFVPADGQIHPVDLGESKDGGGPPKLSDLLNSEDDGGV